MVFIVSDSFVNAVWLTVDPWRPDTPHSEYAASRKDTILRPFKLIPSALVVQYFSTSSKLIALPDGVHHYDEYGLRDIQDEPPEIRKIHGEMSVFVLEWLKAWKKPDET